MELVGEGVLCCVFDVFKVKFEVEGLFDFVCKCLLFCYICCFGVIILVIGVVICDVFSVFGWCWLLLEVDVLFVLV